jgi:hypothetical protein
MRPDDEFDAWMRERRTADVPPGFANRVMAAVARHERAVRIGAIAVACAVGAMRIAAVLTLFVAQ